MRQLRKDGRSGTFANFVDSNIVQVVDIKNKVEIKKTKFQSKNKTNQHEYNDDKQHKQKKHCVDPIPDQFNKRINIHKNSMKGKNSPRSFNLSKVQNGKNIKHKKKKEQEAESEVAKLNPVLQKKMKQKKKKQLLTLSQEESNPNIVTKYNFDIKRLEEMLVVKQKEVKREKNNAKPLSLRERMMVKLKASRFRYLNETLYNSESFESKQYFKNDPVAFKAYHEGYRQQVAQWPINPLNIIISSIKKMLI